MRSTRHGVRSGAEAVFAAVCAHGRSSHTASALLWPWLSQQDMLFLHETCCTFLYCFESVVAVVVFIFLQFFCDIHTPASGKHESARHIGSCYFFSFLFRWRANNSEQRPWWDYSLADVHAVTGVCVCVCARARARAVCCARLKREDT